jgi:hypothetical protein
MLHILPVERVRTIKNLPLDGAFLLKAVPLIETRQYQLSLISVLLCVANRYGASAAL